jgi:hypothetical protein
MAAALSQALTRGGAKLGWLPPDGPDFYPSSTERFIMKKQAKPVSRVSLGYKKLPVEAIPPYGGWEG